MTGHTLALRAAHAHAQTGRFPEMLAGCQRIVEEHGASVDALLDVGVLLMNFGFLGRAGACLDRARALAPHDRRARIHLADLSHVAGDHAGSRRQYAALLDLLSDHPVIRRNTLLSLEYDPDASDAQRLARAREWGAWAIARAGGPRPRPAMRPLDDRPLRVGYVSADFCQHTVGLLVKDVLVAHDSGRVIVYAYGAGQVRDWVTEAIGGACTLRDVAGLDDAALADVIRKDEIDVLVDLSGHTAGSRLTAFARRPAPVMITWLGYFATTGLACMDGVLMDAWHTPPGTEAQFVEPIVRLPAIRFCYQPVPWAPAATAPAPCLRNRHITFGCFNNTTKLNPGVFDVWARILAAVPGSRLVLKWRTFADDAMRESVRRAFATRGIDGERIELRGASFHADVLNEYADIDIALDPFPFSGGLTSCEALWMGVPVVTWPQSRVVSRQTFSLLSVVGLPELAAADGNSYARIAAELAHDTARLQDLRTSLRARMQASRLCDVSGFARVLEATFASLFRDIEQRERTTRSGT